MCRERLPCARATALKYAMSRFSVRCFRTFAAFTSAFSVCPHFLHRNFAWVSRLSRWVCPQRWHVMLLLYGLTCEPAMPFFSP